MASAVLAGGLAATTETMACPARARDYVALEWFRKGMRERLEELRDLYNADKIDRIMGDMSPFYLSFEPDPWVPADERLAALKAFRAKNGRMLTPIDDSSIMYFSERPTIWFATTLEIKSPEEELEAAMICGGQEKHNETILKLSFAYDGRYGVMLDRVQEMRFGSAY